MAELGISAYIPVFFSTLGAVLVLIGLVQRVRLSGSQSWVQVKGVIQRTGIMKIATTAYIPVVEYQYEVDSIEYRHSAIYRWGPATFESKLGAEREISGYQTGQVIAVFYNPRRPVEAFLRYRSRWNSKAFQPTLTTALGILFGILGGGAFFLSFL